MDVPSQACITKDNIQVEVDGILYFQIVDPVKTSYGVNDYAFASIQLAQTTMRSEVGKIELDRTFEEREKINLRDRRRGGQGRRPVGSESDTVRNQEHRPPASIKDAMEKQMRAEREKRALIAESEGDKQAKINRAEGDKQEAIARSEGEKMKRINEAEGRASGDRTRRPGHRQGDPRNRQCHQRTGRRGCREPPDRRIVPRRIRQAGKDQQYLDHPLQPRRCRGIVASVAKSLFGNQASPEKK